VTFIVPFAGGRRTVSRLQHVHLPDPTSVCVSVYVSRVTAPISLSLEAIKPCCYLVDVQVLNSSALSVFSDVRLSLLGNTYAPRLLRIGLNIIPFLTHCRMLQVFWGPVDPKRFLLMISLLFYEASRQAFG